MLVGVDDVEAGVGEEAADRGDQAGAVRAGEQEARCRLVGDPPIVAAGVAAWCMSSRARSSPGPKWQS
jgi:hypothetical protein